MVSEPILVMGFNRPDLLGQVIDRLRTVQPERVFLAIDGSRPDRAGEAERVQACRELAGALDWGCEVQTLFQESNLGCGRGVTSAIGWFFDNVERGIVLEDDILPSPSFFPFCTELLDRYEDDPRVFAVSGCNVVPRDHVSWPSEAYRFSRVPVVWGWATWRRSWLRHRLDITGWTKAISPLRLWQSWGYSVPAAAFWASEFELTARGDVDTWDWQLAMAAMAAGQLTATSNTNLVENLGFGSDATHTVAGQSRLAAATDVALPTTPVPLRVDSVADAWATRHHFGGSLLTTIDRVRQYVQRQRAVR